MIRIACRLALTAVAAITLTAGCASPTGSTAEQHGSAPAAAPATTSAATPAAMPAAAHGVERGISDVPWAQVGPGWALVMWTPVTPHMPGEQPAPGEVDPDKATTVLYLVGPSGDRYSITEFLPGEGDPTLVDWSGDGSHALFAITKERKSYALSVDLHTGDRTTTPVHGTPEYTRPDGKALLVSTSFNGNEPGTLKRIDMSGHEQLAYPTDDLGGAGQFSGDYLESPDGTQLVLGTANLGNEVVPRSDNSLVVMDNNGSIIRTLPVPMQNAYCAPVKWWKPMVFLAHCSAERGSGEQLWEVPVDGGKPTALTAFNSAQGNDPGFEGNLGNWNAYQVPSGVFLPTAGACGTAFVSRLTPDGHTARVDIPGVSDSVELAGVSGDKLVVVAMVGCGGGKSMLTYDPWRTPPSCCSARRSTAAVSPAAVFIRMRSREPMKIAKLAVLAATAATFTCVVSMPVADADSPPEAPGVAAVQLDDLLSAPVPKLCQHEPGNLVNGKLPNQDPRYGHVDVAKRQAPSDDYWVAFGDLTGDGVDDGALVTACSAGGVPWPATVQLYTAGPTRLGGVDLSDLTHGREVVTGLSIADGVVHVSWTTQGPGEPECCGTVHMAGDLRWDGSKVVAENVKRTT